MKSTKKVEVIRAGEPGVEDVGEVGVADVGEVGVAGCVPTSVRKRLP